MQVTIVVDDNLVIVDRGAPHSVDCSALTGIHAVQWYGDYGEIEFKQTGFDPEIKLPIRPPNEHTEDLAPYQGYIDQWRAKEAVRVKEEAEALAAFEAEKAKGLA